MIRFIKFISTYPFRARGYNVESLGDENGSWNIIMDGLSCESVILAAGVGHNISFELDLVKKIGACIHVFDPSPTGVSTINKLVKEEGMEKVIFIPKAISGSSGYIYLEKPDTDTEGSWKATSLSDSESTIKIESVSLSDYCHENAIRHIDLLKIDIEGAEYDVIDNILSEKLSIQQICLEFHCKAQIGIQQTYFDLFRYVFKLFLNGYRIVHLTKSDFTWVKHK